MKQVNQVSTIRRITACEGKVRHPTYGAARRHLKAVRGRGTIEGRRHMKIVVYRCPVGGHWHIGKDRRR